MVISHERIDSFGIGSAAGGLLGGAAFLGLEAAMPHKALPMGFNREATVLSKTMS